MPDRVIRQKILTSDKVNNLSAAAENFYRRLMSVADDFGRFDGRPSILRTSCYPLKVDKIKESDIKKWMIECDKEKVLLIYKVDNKDYVLIMNFNQRLRIMKSKYPAPSDADMRGHMSADVDSCQPVSESETDSVSDTDSSGADKPPTGKKIFIPPTIHELRAYFVQKMGDPKRSEYWPEDKCYFQADKMMNHYVAVGWVYGKGKKIVDWKAAARTWILNHIEWKLDDQPKIPASSKKTNEISEKKEPRQVDKVAEEIEYLFSRFRENPENVTMKSTDIYQYDYLKKFNRIAFSPEKAGEISAAALKVMEEKKIPANSDVQKSYMKKLGILEFFKQLKETGAEAVFHAEN